MKATLLTAALMKSALDAKDVDTLLPDKSNLVSQALLMPGAQRRAGRAAGLAESLGNEAGMATQYPVTSRALAVAGGGALGTLAGGVLSSNLSDPNSINYNNNVQCGLSYGAGLGALGGVLVDTILRIRQEKKIKAEALASLAGGTKPTAALDNGSPLASLVSGVHQQGRADIADTVAHGRRTAKGNPVMTALGILNRIPGGALVGAAPEMGGSLMNFGAAQARIDSAKPRAETSDVRSR